MTLARSNGDQSSICLRGTQGPLILGTREKAKEGGSGRFLPFCWFSQVVIGGGDTAVDCVGTAIRRSNRTRSNPFELPDSPKAVVTSGCWHRQHEEMDGSALIAGQIEVKKNSREVLEFWGATLASRGPSFQDLTAKRASVGVQNPVTLGKRKLEPRRRVP